MNIILGVTDDRAIADSLRNALPKTDLLVVESSVADALRRLVSLRADVVLIDDSRSLGHAAVKEILSAAPTATIVVLLSNDRPDSVAAYMTAGARACIGKPFRLEEFEGVLQTALRTPSPAPAALPPAGYSGGIGMRQHQLAMRWVGRSIEYSDDPNRLLESLVDASVDIFDVARTAALIQARGTIRVAAHHGIPSYIADEVELHFDSGLMRHLEAAPSLIRSSDGRIDDATRKEMSVLGATVVAPLMANGRVCGAIALGDKVDGSDFAGEDIEVLTTVARAASSCLERARRQRDLVSQQSRLDAVLSSITAGVVTVDADRHITMLNESAERLLRVQAVEVLGRSVQKLGSAFADIVLRSLRDGKPLLRQRIHDVALQAELGLSATPLPEGGAVVIFTALPRETADDESDILFSPVWQHLAGRVAQEIKNPMVAISTFAQLLPSKYESEEFREEFSEIVQREVDRINGVVESLYAFAAQPRLNRKPGTLNSSLERVVSEFRAALQERNITLETELAEQDPPVSIDPEQFAEAVRNVIQNSLDAMPSGGTLKIATRRGNGRCEVEISDTGSGPAEADVSQLFVPFFSTKETGMGLGLTMACRIAREHDGDLIVGENPAGGGSFVIRLPVAAEG